MASWRTYCLLGFMSALLTAACETAPAPEAAVLKKTDAETMAKVMTVLAGALNVASVEFGGGDPSQAPVISVLPPPLGPHEDRSPAMPVLFDLVLRKDGCYAVRRETGEAFWLEGVGCYRFVEGL